MNRLVQVNWVFYGKIITRRVSRVGVLIKNVVRLVNLILPIPLKTEEIKVTFDKET